MGGKWCLALAAIALVGCNQAHYKGPDSANPLSVTLPLTQKAEAPPEAAQVLLRFKPGLSSSQRNAFRAQFRLQAMGYLKATESFVEALPSDVDSAKQLLALRAHPWVASAELNGKLRALR